MHIRSSHILYKYVFPFRWENPRAFGKIIVALDYYPDKPYTKQYKVPIYIYPHVPEYRHFLKRRISNRVKAIDVKRKPKTKPKKSSIKTRDNSGGAKRTSTNKKVRF